MSNSYVEVVKQAINLLDEISLNDYQKGIAPHFPSSIGAHIRHVIDHFLALIGSEVTGEVNYNKRNRYGDVEMQPQVAIQKLEEIIDWLQTVCQMPLEQPVSVTSEIDISHTKSSTCQSTLERELVFAASHAIHHYALIRVIRSMQGEDLPEFFGYAPATITHITRSA